MVTAVEKGTTLAKYTLVHCENFSWVDTVDHKTAIQENI
jgi:hypothetical protein